MADKYCENGHLIDETWDICPYCSAADAPAPVVLPRTSAGPSALPAAGPVAVPAPDELPPSQRPADERVPVLADFSSVDGFPRGFQRTVAVKRADVRTAITRYVVGWLVGLTATGRGESWPVRSGRNVIGRDKRSEIAVNDEQVSAHHADLIYRPEERRFILMDHNSTNGTYVNDAEIEPRRNLAKGDIIRVGSHKFLFVPLCTDEMYWEGEGPLK